MTVDLTPEKIEALIADLGKDVFYGDERLHRMKQHNPLHLNAISTLRALSARVVELEAERDKWALSSHGQAWDRITAEAALATARADALREAAAWHIRQAENAMGALHCGSENSEYRAAGRLNDMHRAAAAHFSSLIHQQEKPHE